MPFDPPDALGGGPRHYTLCVVCSAHPGWAHDDQRERSEPADTCKACYGSGRTQEPNVPVLLNLARAYTLKADAALRDEAERDLRVAVLRLANVSAALTHIVTTW